MIFDYDLFVIGGGLGGVCVVCIVVSEYGVCVGLVEESCMGGICVICGCVFKKLMIFVLQVEVYVVEVWGYGWVGVQVGVFDWQFFYKKLDVELIWFEGVYIGGFVVVNVEIYKSCVKLYDVYMVELVDGQCFIVKYILIVVGGCLQLLGFEGEELGLILDDLFLMDKLLGCVLVVGGGFIVCEFVMILNGLGVEIVLVYCGDVVLCGFDMEMCCYVIEQLCVVGVDLCLNQKDLKLEKDGDWVCVYLDEGFEIFDVVMFVIGCVFYIKGLGLEELGVKLVKNGVIVVDDYL